MDPAGEHRAAIEAGSQDIVYLVVSVSYPATELFLDRAGFFGEAEFRRIFITFLFLQFCVINATAIDAGWSSGLHAAGFEP